MFCRQTDLAQTTDQGIRADIVSPCADRTELRIYREWPVTMLEQNAINSGLERIQVDGAVKQNHMME
uniref:Kinetochore protein NDC80 n=1 Tax=Parascaris univalens TaxID=6257 RepID=A0A914ZTK6_PARUN